MSGTGGGAGRCRVQTRRTRGVSVVSHVGNIHIYVHGRAAMQMQTHPRGSRDE